MNFFLLAVVLIQTVSASSFAAKTFMKKAARMALMASAAGAYKGIHRSECVPERPGFFEDWHGVAKCQSQGLNFNQVAKNPAYLLVALHQGNVDAVKNYLRNGVDPNILDNERNDFFYYALKHDFPIEVIQMAMVNGLDINEVEAKTGLLPVDRVIEAGRYDLARLLINQKAKHARSHEDLISQVIEKSNEGVYNLAPYYLVTALLESSDRKRELIESAMRFARDHGRHEFLAYLSAFARGSY